MIYAVPTSAMKDWLKGKSHIICADEAEAVAMACGDYLATGQPATVAMGENGFLKALDVIITLSQLQEIPVDLLLFTRADEPQHKMVTDKLEALAQLFNIQYSNGI